MKIKQLIAKLEQIQAEHGDIHVMLEMDDDISEVLTAYFHVAEEDEFPEEYNMPTGFKFVVLSTH